MLVSSVSSITVIRNNQPEIKFIMNSSRSKCRITVANSVLVLVENPLIRSLDGGFLIMLQACEHMLNYREMLIVCGRVQGK